MSTAISLYEEKKLEATYTLKTLATIIEVLRGSKAPEDPRAALILETGYSTYSFTVGTEAEALYLRRKLRKIIRLSFKDEISISIETRD